MGISVEVLPDAGAPQVGVTVTGLDDQAPSVVSVQVSWDGGVSWHGVRGAERIERTEALFVRDHVPPLNVQATYRVVVHSGAVVPDPDQAQITVPSGTAWIQDPLDPRAAVPLSGRRYADGIVMQRATAADVTRRQVVDLATPSGARLPVASIGRRVAPSEIALHLRAQAAAQGELILALRAMLDAAGQVVLRGLPPELGLDPVLHVAAGDVSERPSAQGFLGGFHDWHMTVLQVRPTSLQVVIPWWTYEQVQALWDGWSYDEATAERPGDTYLDWQRDPEVP